MAEVWITTEEAAEIVGVTTHQIRYLLRNNLIRGKKFARSWMVERQSAEEYASMEHKPGPRPKSN